MDSGIQTGLSMDFLCVEGCVGIVGIQDCIARQADQLFLVLPTVCVQLRVLLAIQISMPSTEPVFRALRTVYVPQQAFLAIQGITRPVAHVSRVLRSVHVQQQVFHAMQDIISKRGHVLCVRQVIPVSLMVLVLAIARITAELGSLPVIFVQLDQCW